MSLIVATITTREVVEEVEITTKEEDIEVVVQIIPVMATKEPPTKKKVTFNVIIVKITGTIQLNAIIHKKEEVIKAIMRHT